MCINDSYVENGAFNDEIDSTQNVNDLNREEAKK